MDEVGLPECLKPGKGLGGDHPVTRSRRVADTLRACRGAEFPNCVSRRATTAVPTTKGLIEQPGTRHLRRVGGDNKRRQVKRRHLARRTTPDLELAQIAIGRLVCHGATAIMGGAGVEARSEDSKERTDQPIVVGRKMVGGGRKGAVC
jgi:hypothetical protein